MAKLYQFTLFLAFALVIGFAASGQQVVRQPDGRVAGRWYSAGSQAGTYIVLVSDDESRTAGVEIASRLNRLGINALLADGIVVDSWATLPLDSCIGKLRQLVEAVKKQTAGTVGIVGASRAATVALVAATVDFRIKSVIALEPGEFFPPAGIIAKRLQELRVPTLVLYQPKDKERIARLLEWMPERLLVLSGTLGKPGVTTLLGNDTQSGEAWLAITLFVGRNVER
ncbi:MAG: hypothetical protein ACFNOP_04310 [Bacteroides sp.]|jgi:hypothetical protein